MLGTTQDRDVWLSDLAGIAVGIWAGICFLFGEASVTIAKLIGPLHLLFLAMPIVSLTLVALCVKGLCKAQQGTLRDIALILTLLSIVAILPTAAIAFYSQP